MERARVRKQSPTKKSVGGLARGCSCGVGGGVVLHLLSTHVRCISDS